MSIPKYEQLKEAIKDKINSGHWLPGEKIPAQRELEDSFKVSRITVKKAVSDLINEKYLEHLPGKKGLFIVKQGQGHSFGSKTIAVAVDDVTDRFGATLLRGIEDCLWEQKYHTIICNADRDFGKVEEYFHSFDYGKVDGIIFSPVIDMGYRERNLKIISLLKEKGIPYVLLDRYIPGNQSSYVISDNFDSARQMADSLIKSGHRRILVGMGLECSGVTDRILGIRQAFEDNGLDFEEDHLIHVNDNRLYPQTDPEEMEQMKAKVEKAGEFTAYYATNNRLLKAGIESMLSLGIDVHTIQLALHNEVSKPVHPYTDNIPRITPRVHKMGWTAASVLLDNIADGNETVKQVIVKSDIHFENLKPGEN